MTRLAYLFQRYFDKTATPEEAAEFMHLADQEEHAAEILKLMERAWAQLGEEDVFSAEQSSAMLWKILQSDAAFGDGSEQVARPDGGERQVPGDLARAAADDRAVVDDRAAADDRAVVADWDQLPVRRIRWRRFAVAAVLVGMLGSGVWWVAHSRADRPMPVAQRVSPSSVAPVPGRPRAELVLGDGSTMTLDSMHSGLLTTQGNTRVEQVAGGRLAYGATAGVGNGASGNAGADGGAAASAGAGRAGSMGQPVTVLYNTLRTPRGGQYQLDLPDGSRVWLNAATSLRFPTSFTGPDRTVELTGEAYFEIAPNKQRPFRVKVGDMTVDVLGTHFNIMAYSDEASVNTTLLQGAVRVEAGTGSKTLRPGGAGAAAKVLRPGESARMNAGTRELVVEAVDTDQAIAWKNGLFEYEGATLETVMRQIARWYDVEVRYETTVTRHFSGLISRNKSLQDVLQMLDAGVRARFILEGRTVVVKAR